MDLKISLVTDTINNSDIDELIFWLKSYPRLTKGEQTEKFEKKWSQYLGSKDSVFVNSGSSANLVMLQTLIEVGKLSKGDKVVVPCLAWATDLAPVVQLGLIPVLCDCNLEDLSLDLDHLEMLLNEHDIKVVILVSVLGLVPDMQRILQLCNENKVELIEDACESFGSEYHGKKLGTFGLASSFSTYFGHHLSTIEGGIISTSDAEFCDVLRSVRSHGWDRDVTSKLRKSLREEWKVSEFEALYTFYYHGFNVRSTDLQANLGIRQLDKSEEIVLKRENNYWYYHENINNDYWRPVKRDNCRISNFAFPIIHPKRDVIVKELQKNGVEVRPLICRSMGSQPFYVKLYGEQKHKNASAVDKFGLYIPNHTGLSDVDMRYIVDIVNNAIKIS